MHIIYICKCIDYNLHNLHKLQNTNSKRENLIEQIYISPMVLRMKLLASTDGSNIQYLNNTLGYHNIFQFIFEYAEKGAFERNAEFR
jgi:hypothetical protein